MASFSVSPAAQQRQGAVYALYTLNPVTGQPQSTHPNEPLEQQAVRALANNSPHSVWQRPDELTIMFTGHEQRLVHQQQRIMEQAELMDNPMLANVGRHNLEALKMALALRAQPLNVTHFPHNPPLPLGSQQAEEGPPLMMNPYPSMPPHARHPHHRHHQAMVVLMGSPRLQQAEETNLTPFPEPTPHSPNPAPDPLPQSPPGPKEVLSTLPTHPTRDETGAPPQGNGLPPFMPGPTPSEAPPPCRFPQ